jgi:hypothetical protein
MRAAHLHPSMSSGSNVGSSPGLWFLLEGTGKPVQIKLTESSNTISLHKSVYTGSCDALECVGQQYFAFTPFIWDTVEGEEYLIYVYSQSYQEADIFTIMAEEVVRPANDLCKDAVALELNAVVAGTSRFASGLEDDVEPCFNLLGRSLGGVWYSFEGNGGTMVVGLNTSSSFDSVLSIYEGDCDAQTCVGFHDQNVAYQNFENFVVLDSVSGATYHAYVRGFDSATGDFEISVFGVERPANDACANAIALQLGDSVEGSTSLASNEINTTMEGCGASTFAVLTAPGIWYTVVGGGFPVQASVNANYDMQLTVFTGGCETLVCVNGTAGNPGDFFNGEVIWTAEEGVTYTFLVHGFNGVTGDFELFYETAIF